MEETNYKLVILQQNVAKLYAITQSILQTGLEVKADAIFVQEPCISHGNLIAHSAYWSVLPNCPNPETRPRVAVYWRKQSAFKYSQITHLVDDPDILVLNISGPGLPEFQMINIYNEKRSGNDTGIGQYTVERSLQRVNLPSNKAIICGDFNAHHHWWNSEIETPERSENLVTWLTENDFELLNTPDISTFDRPNLQSISILDLAFATPRMASKVVNWQISDDLQNGSDHALISFAIATENTELVENPAFSKLYNLEKADWDQFAICLKNATGHLLIIIIIIILQ
jgi:exonuclease III